MKLKYKQITYNCLYYQQFIDGIHIPRNYVKMVTVADIHDFINTVVSSNDYELIF